MTPPDQAQPLRGLGEPEAAERLRRFGFNALPAVPPTPLWRRALAQFTSPLVYMLLFALAIDLGLWAWNGGHGTPIESIAIAAILLLNAGLGVIQEARAEEALARLRAMALPSAWVLREGLLRQIPATGIVPGDLVRIEAGDRIPADGHLCHGDGLMADESILTGESLPVDKALGSELFSGALLVRGKGYLEVTRTGPQSTMGKLATLIGNIETAKTPLERRLAEFGNQVALAIAILGAVLIVGGLMAEGWSRAGPIVLFAVALAVAAVPEGLPAVLTLTLALGVERLSQRKAIVRRLSAVEALGSVTVIATDKTGTLTENRMHVRGLDAPDVEGAIMAMVLANDAELKTGAGDPLEVALLEFAGSNGAIVSDITARCPRIAARPFDSLTRFMRVTVASGDTCQSFLKGAPEVLIARSTLSDDGKRAWHAKAEAHAREGHRVLALAAAKGTSDDALDFLGLVMLWDPPRPEVHDALKQAREAGIRVVMITGDHPATAQAVATALGIETDGVLTGDDLDVMLPGTLRDVVARGRISVFARVTPEHKLKLVEALRAAGHVVAVTGDGVNDAPALKRSDVGVAMGQRGSDVSREVSDLVLSDDNFATIVGAISEGRSIYANIQTAIRFLFSANLALVLLICIGLAVSFAFGITDSAGGLFLPLTAVQLLWINVVANGPPALALALDRNPNVMRHPPRPANAALLDPASLRFILVTGGIKAVLGVVLLITLPRQGYTLDETRTAVFLFESIAQLMYVFPSRRTGAVPLSNRALHVTIVAAIALQAATVLLPGLRGILGLVPLETAVWGTVALTILGAWLSAEAVSHWLRTHPSAR